MQPFAALSGATKSVSGSTTSGSVAFDATTWGAGGVDVLVTNGGTVLAFVDFGDSNVTASSADTPIPGGGQRVIRVKNAPASPVTHAAAITASGTATIYFTPGDGGV